MQDKFPYSDFNAIVWKEGEREGDGPLSPSLSLPPCLPPSFPVFHFGLTTTTTATRATCVNQCSCPAFVYSECGSTCDDASRDRRRCRAVETCREFLPHLPYITSSSSSSSSLRQSVSVKRLLLVRSLARSLSPRLRWAVISNGREESGKRGYVLQIHPLRLRVLLAVYV